MNRWSRGIGWVFWVMAVFAVGSSVAEGASPRSLQEIRARGELVVGIEDDTWGRFHIWDKGSVEGLEVDLAERIAQAVGVSLRVMPIPWGKGEAGTISGSWESGTWVEADLLLAGITTDAERAQKVTFSDWYFSAGQTVLFRKALGARTTGDLAGRRVSFQGGTTSEAVVRDSMPRSEAVPFATWSDAFSAFMEGTVDAVVVDSPLAIQKARENPELHVLGVLLSRERYGVAMPKDVDPEFKALVDQVVRQCREELFRKWFS